MESGGSTFSVATMNISCHSGSCWVFGSHHDSHHPSILFAELRNFT